MPQVYTDSQPDEGLSGNTSDFVEVGEAGIAVKHVMRRQLAVQHSWRRGAWQREQHAQPG